MIFKSKVRVGGIACWGIVLFHSLVNEFYWCIGMVSIWHYRMPNRSHLAFWRNMAI